jgi:hypothetical protein
VPEASAALDGYQRIALDAKHNMLPKHNSNKAQGFITISSRIKELVGKAQDYLAERGRKLDLPPSDLTLINLLSQIEHTQMPALPYQSSSVITSKMTVSTKTPKKSITKNGYQRHVRRCSRGRLT